MGQLGLRNQYVVTVLGLNVVVFATVSYMRMGRSGDEIYLVVAAMLTYLILGPIVFMGPLMPFHRGMLREKQRVLGEVVQRLGLEFERLRGQIPAGRITRHDDEQIERLRKLGRDIDDLPVWPFDPSTLKKFASAYGIPVAVAILEQAVTRLTDWLVPIH
jgi:hypothetical protein